MNVLLVALIGVAVVLVAILFLRIHALIALLLGSLLILALTPASIRLDNASRKYQVKVEQTQEAQIAVGQLLAAGEYYLLASDRKLNVDRVVLLEDGERIHDKLAWYKLGSTSEHVPKTGDFLVAVNQIKHLSSTLYLDIGNDLTQGFADTFRKLGIPVTMAAIIGVCLIESGAATRLVLAIASVFGTRGTAPALTVSGFLLGVPVFFENVFYLLLPLAKAIGKQRPEFFLTAVMAIIVGATMAHSLVPPTPGPLLVCRELGVSIKAMMLGGFVVGGIASACGFIYGLLCRRWVSLLPEQIDAPNTSEAKTATTETSPQIPLVLAVLPIALPVAAFSLSKFAEDNPGLVFLSTAIFSLLLLRYYAERQRVVSAIAKGIADAGVIVLLTCAGGAFGASLQQLQLADAIAANFQQFKTPWGLLVAAWLLTAIIRAAQGSATVAMITTAGIVAPVMATMDLPYHPVYLALAIGCGSKPFPWLNDSGFWQVSTMTGMTVSQTLKTFSAALTIMGFVGFLVTLIGAWLLPLR